MRSEYNLGKKPLNTDFIPYWIKKTELIILDHNLEGSVLLFNGKNDVTIYKIPLKSITSIYEMEQEHYKKIDKLIQIVFTEETHRVRIIRLNVEDSQIDKLIREINDLKERESKTDNQPTSTVEKWTSDW